MIGIDNGFCCHIGDDRLIRNKDINLIQIHFKSFRGRFHERAVEGAFYAQNGCQFAVLFQFPGKLTQIPSKSAHNNLVPRIDQRDIDLKTFAHIVYGFLIKALLLIHDGHESGIRIGL